MIGGAGRSWTVPVYILNGNFPDVFPADEDPVPFVGEPHPEHPPVVIGANAEEPNWENELNGAAPNLGIFGGNPHPQNQPHQGMAQNVQEQASDNMQVDEEDDEQPENLATDDDPWPKWNPQVFAPLNQQNQVPQHPDVPQHSMDIDLSGSSMCFLRATGPDISLEELYQALQNDSSSSTSSDASSAFV